MKKDKFTGFLFESSLPQKELAPGFHYNERGEIVDKKENVYDKNGILIKEAPSEGLLEARRRYPNLTDNQLAPLATILQRQFEKRKK